MPFFIPNSTINHSYIERDGNRPKVQLVVISAFSINECFATCEH